METIIIATILIMAGLQIITGTITISRIRKLEKEGKLQEDHKSFKMSK
jgi:hypothetical protein